MSIGNLKFEVEFLPYEQENAISGAAAGGRRR
jgi:hypothetical protein